MTAFTNDAANTTVLTNDALAGSNVLTIDDMIIAIDSGEGSLDYPRTPIKNDSANTTTLTNDAANA